MSKIENLISVSIIWVAENDSLESPWVEAAWDEYMIDNNYDGWQERISRARDLFEHVRITSTILDYAAIQSLFAPTTITNHGTKENN